MSEGSPITDADREELVAWLDGEVDARRSTLNLARLSTDEMLQKEVEGYRRTWDLLGALPMPTPTRDFTSRTVSLASQELAALRTLQSQAGAPKSSAVRKKFLERPIVFAGLLAVCFVSSFAVMRGGLGPNRKIVELAPLLTRLDEYRAAGDIEFLRELHRQKVFEPATDSMANPDANANPPWPFPPPMGGPPPLGGPPPGPGGFRPPPNGSGNPMRSGDRPK